MKTGDEIFIVGATYQFGILDNTKAVYVGAGYKVNGGQIQQYVLINGRLSMVGEEHIKIKKTIMSNITTLIRNITRTEPEKTFVKVGFIDESENITEKGKEALNYILWQTNKDALKVLADKIDETKS